MRPAWPLPALALWVCTAAGCPPTTTSGDARGKGAPAAEERFGNDPELVADFANLKTCVYRGGRVDQACEQLRTLQRRLEVKSRDPEKAAKVATTLANLLESRRELTRLVAAESAFYQHRDPRLAAALKQAFRSERAPAVRATILRQLCFAPSSAALANLAAATLLAPQEHELVRTEAASCIGRQQAQREAAVPALQAALKREYPARVRGDCCAALGALRATESVAQLVALLSQEDVDWRCGAALGEIGTEPAYRALIEAVEQTLGRGRIPTQHVTALTSFEGTRFFERERVLGILGRIAAERRVSWVARKRAVAELGRMGGRAQLAELRRVYGAVGAQASDELVRKELERVMGPARP